MSTPPSRRARAEMSAPTTAPAPTAVNNRPYPVAPSPSAWARTGSSAQNALAKPMNSAVRTRIARNRRALRA